MPTRSFFEGEMMVELSEKAFALSISMILIVTGFKISQTVLFPKVSTAAALMQYNALVERLRQGLLQASATPVRLQFDSSMPPGVTIYGDGKALVLKIETSLGSRIDRIQTSLNVAVQVSAQSGDITVFIDSTDGEILVKIGGR
jgi:hypothetical protein